MTANSPESKRRRAARATGWSAVGTATDFSATLTALFVTSRLVEPSEFGIYTGWFAVMMIASEAASAGLRYKGVLVESSPDSARSPVGSARIWIATLAVAALGVLAAVAIGRTGDIAVMLVLSVLIPARSVFAQTEGELAARMEFKLLSMNQAAAAMVYLATSVVLAAAWHNALALAIAQLTLFLVRGAVMSTLGVARVRSTPLPAKLTSLSRTDFALGAAISVQTSILSQVDNLIVGARLGIAELGIYGRAYRLSVTPARLFSDAVGTVLFPLFARHAGERDTRRLLDLGDALSVTLLIPFSCTVAIFSREILRLALGAEWVTGAAAMAILSLTLLFHVQTKFLQSAVLATGDLRMVLRNSTVRLAALIVGAALGAQWDLSGVAMGVSAAIAIGYLRLRVVSNAGFATSAARFAAAAAVLCTGLLLIGALIRSLTAAWYLGLALFAPLAVVIGAAAGLRLLGPGLGASLGTPRRIPRAVVRFYGLQAKTEALP